ncbi:Ribosome biogenesis protein ENP2 [Penicillium macrosclerotiorum]|uniref:Ribosome biogenesis protein ENP2 n=1 Tax=Penicillium macrosclerotiorum TaxID=303699 RepID=UPI0025469BFD|nr:Ribosome biogenesis protein ENP2 [Penicillium macrosclerotiorum]KAJ5669570.1 Ribosome biogenesis protein ENP2 [Penicillium macrosclerotiorum]
MKLSNQSEVPVYTISGSNTARPLPEWLARRRKRSLKDDPEYANRVELLQDFEFEEASQCVRVSDDGEWVMSTGTYKPQIHTHYLPQLSLSWARHTVALNTTFLLLSSDYSKSLHLQSDRSLEFHTPQGCHYTTRLPRYGRDLIYDRQSTEALIPAVGVNQDGLGEVFRLNLEMGRYMRSFEVDVGGDDFTSAGGGTLQGGINTGAVNTGAIAEDSHGLMAFGTSIGTVELWDPRAKGRAGILLPPAQTGSDEARSEITALEFQRSGLTLGTGSSNGLIHLYDLRSPVPLLKKDQGYGFPIHTLKFLQPSSATREATLEPKIMSADKRIIKIWDPRDGSPWTSVEPAVDINSVAWCKDSGMLLTANEGRQQHSFFIPQLGPAPKWCSFLDNLVEEMAEDPNDPNAFTSAQAGSVYDNYKFLTVPQLRSLNLEHLIGRTNLLRPYMHGYFVAQRLYEEARLITNPYIWEEERAKRVKEKIDKERESRIRGKKKAAVKVNKKLAERLLLAEEKNERRRAKQVLERGGDEEMVDAAVTEAGSTSKGVLKDSRFNKLFEDEEFAVDETSHEFRAINPSTVPDVPARKERGLTAVEEEAVDDVPGSSDDDSESEPERPVAKKSGKISSADYKRTKRAPPRMQISSSTRTNSARDRSFGSRAQNMKSRQRPARQSGVVGEKEVSFMPASKSRSKVPEVQYDKTEFRSKERRSASGNTFRKM